MRLLMSSAGRSALMLVHDATNARVGRKPVQQLQRPVFPRRNAGNMRHRHHPVPLYRISTAGRLDNSRRRAGAARRPRKLLVDGQHAGIILSGLDRADVGATARNQHNGAAVCEACSPNADMRRESAHMDKEHRCSTRVQTLDKHFHAATSCDASSCHPSRRPNNTLLECCERECSTAEPVRS